MVKNTANKNKRKVRLLHGSGRIVVVVALAAAWLCARTDLAVTALVLKHANTAPHDVDASFTCIA